MTIDAQSLDALDPRLSDPIWRLSNLYFIKTKAGETVRFAPRPGQWKVIHAIHRDGLRKMIIPKARQLGISTVIALIILDLMLFKRGLQAAIVDMTQSDASKKLKGKILFAFERLPDFLKVCYDVLDRNNRTFSITLRREGDTTRQVQAGMHARGDTFQFLHVSEWGIIAFRDPARSEEIVTGALQAAENGIVVVETTWKGGKVGHLWDYTKKALETRAAHRTDRDFAVFFCPWWEDPEYTLEGDNRQISAECRRYLDEVEEELMVDGTASPLVDGAERKKTGNQHSTINHQPFRFTPGQRLWYYKVAWVLGLFRFQEYPSMLSECFRAPIEGAIYAELLDKARAEGRIGAVETEPGVTVNTCWDLGGPANIVTWYFQLVGEQIRILDCDTHLDLTPNARVAHILQKAAANGWQLGFHFLPHDAEAKDDKGRTIQAELESAGLINTRVIPRTADVWVGINRVRLMMARMAFNSPACDVGLNSLEAYHTGVWIERGRAMDLPVHDKASHAADALRTMAEAELAGMLEGGWVKSIFAKEGLKALSNC